MFLTFLEVASRCILWKMEEEKHAKKEEGNTQHDPKCSYETVSFCQNMQKSIILLEYAH